MAKIKQNSYVLFFYNDSKKWLVKISKNDQLHTHIGVMKHGDAIGKEYGSRLVTNKDKYVYLFEPTIHDFVMKMQHGTQIVYPKDLGYIVARTGITSGQKVVEIGTGSGSLTSFLAGIVKPRGHVYTYDVEPKFMKIAEKNIKKAGMSKYITMKEFDFKIEKLVHVLVQNEFSDIECTEQILRHIEAREGKTRHSFRGIGHTTYLAYARKSFFDKKPAKKSTRVKTKTVSKKKVYSSKK